VVQGLYSGIRVKDSGSKVWGFGFRAQDSILELRFHGLDLKSKLLRLGYSEIRSGLKFKVYYVYS